MENVILVGMADLNVCESPDAIKTLALGSCVGIVLYEPYQKVAGMAHIMLPDSTQIRNSDNHAKFADTGIESLINTMKDKFNIDKRRLRAKIAGGAQMFNFGTKNEMLRIGDRNIEATKRNLALHNIPLVCEDVGDNYGRTITFYPDTSELHIMSHGRPSKII